VVPQCLGQPFEANWERKYCTNVLHKVALQCLGQPFERTENGSTVAMSCTRPCCSVWDSRSNWERKCCTNVLHKAVQQCLGQPFERTENGSVVPMSCTRRCCSVWDSRSNELRTEVLYQCPAEGGAAVSGTAVRASPRQTSTSYTYSSSVSEGRGWCTSCIPEPRELSRCLMLLLQSPDSPVISAMLERSYIPTKQQFSCYCSQCSLQTGTILVGWAGSVSITHKASQLVSFLEGTLNNDDDISCQHE
jgi:hypothetical protein